VVHQIREEEKRRWLFDPLTSDQNHEDAGIKNSQFHPDFFIPESIGTP